MSARQLRHPFFRTPCRIKINDQTYNVHRKLDNGSFGQVYIANPVHEKDKLIAIKVMSHERIKMEKQSKRIDEEINLHSSINPNNVNWLYQNQSGLVRLYTFDHNVKIKRKLYKCMVMEYCEGSHLNQYLRNHPSDRLQEIEAFYFFQQIMRSLQCLHQQHVIHRDIKPQNLLLSNCKKSLPILKLCDFGLAKRLSHSAATTHSMCGTPNYVAPEIVKAEGHSYGVDIWSAGIVLYTMLVKHHAPPFETGNAHMTMARVRDKEVVVPNYLSQECQSFLSQLLIKNKHKRITAQQLKQHVWYRHNKNKLSALFKEGLHPINTTYLRNYSKCFKNKGCIYEINGDVARLSWGGKQYDDCAMDVRNSAIWVEYGGITHNPYNINTLPISYWHKYNELYYFFSIHSRNTPLITISIGNDNDDDLKESDDAFNHKHYAILVHSQIVDYHHEIEGKARIFIEYSKRRDKYIGYYDDLQSDTQISFNVLETEQYQEDIILFQELKQRLFGEFTQRYINDNTSKFPVVLQYMDHDVRASNATFDKLFAM